ncbi:sodium-translocating pyrophosphatase [Aeromicrobium sp. SMF47]|uniref:K(+)-insensitive pyrophosphate-energized proton pump n=1 Tax=Aeromicrobium yanjiei TaxID=2662028 RepID=A0A5Q2MEF9_9ACTN|nr:MULTISPECIES: sodium-translocating pyrophosphatase [Aeromicrobium]MRJ75353.1 sodium-translocating pyrophosphatase [Aeromicrobium yanjiei]MRK02589.1 sodium-translocating pyrophosphatase [Aeromicrobium sp. S22]QGG40193.1 sodium-translocating pyrophosphatase [Aeromicrobium yanjiei]
MANATVVAAVGGDLDFSDKNSFYLYAVVAIGALALVLAGVFRSQVLKASEGTAKMQEIGQAVQEGASAYLSRQFKTLAVFAVIALLMLIALDAAVLGWDNDWKIKIGRYVALVAGAGFSALIGYLGMWLATRANIRVAAAAQTEGREVAMRIAFRTGGTVGMMTVGLGLLGAGTIVLIYTGDAPVVLEGFGFGAALLAMFMRVGGGIFTKAADVGADLVGKVEQNIPEDDPRNAATIADNVGDNVGDCAGMAADLFESYAVTLVAALILGSVAFGEVGLVFPLVIPAIGALTAILGVFITKPRPNEGGLTTINRSFYITALVSAVASIGAAFLLLPSKFSDASLPGIDTQSLIVTVGQQQGLVAPGLDANPRLIAIIAVLIGIVLAAVILALTGYFTGTETRPVKDVGKTSLTGAATVILSGLSVGFESAVYTAIVIGAAVFGAFLLGSGSLVVALFAVALAGCGLLTTVGVIVAMDTFGPVSDNAQGIAEMSGDVDEEGAQILTELDAVGNTTKAITKGIAIATAVLAATALFGSLSSSISTAIEASGVTSSPDAADLSIIETYAWLGVLNVGDPSILVGLILGAAVVFLFSGLAINAVGRAAGAVVYEVRRQFREIPGIMEGTGRPEYGKVVDICTRDSLRELATPGILAIFAPIAVGFGLGIGPLGGYLAGAIGTGVLMAVFLANSGGAWDNAKKLVEDGNHGGKGSPAHEATIIGDTVGDPFKDTAGPAINPLLKVMNLVALLATPLIIKYSYGDDASDPIRYTIAGVAVVIIVAAVYISKRRPIALDTTAIAEPEEIATS